MNINTSVKINIDQSAGLQSGTTVNIDPDTSVDTRCNFFPRGWPYYYLLSFKLVHLHIQYLVQVKEMVSGRRLCLFDQCLHKSTP